MTKGRKLLDLATRNPAGLSFSELCTLAAAAGFTLLRVKGDHHIFGKTGVDEILNFQPEKGKAKRYQVKQLLDLIEQYAIEIE